MRKHLQFFRGTTLVELLLYMGIFLILLVTLLQIFSSILDVQLESQASSAVTQDGRYLLQRFAYDIGNAQSITTPTGPGTTGPSLQLVISGITYTYSLVNGNLQLTQNSTTDNLNSIDTTVSGLSFQRLGSVAGKNTVTISFTLTSAATRFEGKETQHFVETIGLR